MWFANRSSYGGQDFTSPGTVHQGCPRNSGEKEKSQVDLSPLRAIVAFGDAYLCTESVRSLSDMGFEVTACKQRNVSEQESLAESYVVIETGDDAALLTRVVYEIYMATGATWTLPILGLVTEAAFESNPSIGVWLINGHSATITVQTIRGNTLRDIRLIGFRMKSVRERRMAESAQASDSEG